MASLVGSWQFVGADNLDGYMQAAGKNILNFPPSTTAYSIFYNKILRFPYEK